MTSRPRSVATSKSRPMRLSEETPEEDVDKEELLVVIELKEENANPKSVNNKRRRKKRLLKMLLSKRPPRPKTSPLPSVRAEEEALVKVNSDVLF